MITFTNVTKKYPDGTVAVDDLTLEVPEGTLTVFVGPSGCGKTTSMRMINRMIEPTSGTLTVNGEDVTEVDPVKLRLGMGYVIQSAGLMPHLRVVDNVATVPVLRANPGEAHANPRSRCSNGWGWTRRWPTGIRRSCPAASSNASEWRGRWRRTRRSC